MNKTDIADKTDNGPHVETKKQIYWMHMMHLLLPQVMLPQLLAKRIVMCILFLETPATTAIFHATAIAKSIYSTMFFAQTVLRQCFANAKLVGCMT